MHCVAVIAVVCSKLTGLTLLAIIADNKFLSGTGCNRDTIGYSLNLDEFLAIMSNYEDHGISSLVTRVHEGVRPMSSRPTIQTLCHSVRGAGVVRISITCTKKGTRMLTLSERKCPFVVENSKF